jgi:hypothetical protein
MSMTFSFVVSSLGREPRCTAFRAAGAGNAYAGTCTRGGTGATAGSGQREVTAGCANVMEPGYRRAALGSSALGG